VCQRRNLNLTAKLDSSLLHNSLLEPGAFHTGFDLYRLAAPRRVQRGAHHLLGQRAQGVLRRGGEERKRKRRCNGIIGCECSTVIQLDEKVRALSY
jgi:hypothetical protein